LTLEGLHHSWSEKLLLSSLGLGKSIWIDVHLDLCAEVCLALYRNPHGSGVAGSCT
jgi:hypothetical protein